MKKRILSLCMVLILALGLLPAAALAADVPFTAAVDGTALTDFSHNTLTWTGLAGSKTVPCYTAAVPTGSSEAKLTFTEAKSLAYYSSTGQYISSVDGEPALCHIVAVTDNNNDGESDLIAVLNSSATDVDYCIRFTGPAAANAKSNCLAAKSDAPTDGTTSAGGLYKLPLKNVFTDSSGHGITYSYSVDKAVNTEHTKIANGTFYFSAQNEGNYTVTLTARCGSAEVSHALNLTVEAANEGITAQYNYNETPASSVTVYVTLSSDGMPLLAQDGETVLSHMAVTVPYFDLALYGLEDYYRYGTDGGKGIYTNDNLIQRPTGLHLYIYLLERYYMGLPEKLCGKGLDSGVLNYYNATDICYMDGSPAYESNGKAALSTSGGPTSIYMVNFWGHDENLMYFRNHCYPYMSPGWGSTSDYILLSDGDTWDVAMFSNWNFYLTGFFSRFDKDEYTVRPGEKLTVNTLRWGTTAEAAGFTPINGDVGMSVALYDSDWKELNVFSYDSMDGNSITITVPEEDGTYYLMAIDPNCGTSDAEIAPATARLVVRPRTLLDVAKDIWDWINGGETGADVSEADQNSDGKLDMKDVSAMLRALR